jgi:DNA-binding response OmpR family regulator
MSWHILIVDDETDAGEIVKSMLSLEGLEADVVNTAEEALKVLNNQDYHAAVIDLMLPGMDGLDLARNIRSNVKLSKLPCIAITAYGSGSLRREASEAGYNLYYAKPVAQQDLVDALHQLLD